MSRKRRAKPRGYRLLGKWCGRDLYYVKPWQRDGPCPKCGYPLVERTRDRFFRKTMGWCGVCTTWNKPAYEWAEEYIKPEIRQAHLLFGDSILVLGSCWDHQGRSLFDPNCDMMDFVWDGISYRDDQPISSLPTPEPKTIATRYIA